ncbi:hypothetical protein A3H10_03545 [Candidatus Uhrbacteria bacterium RIFCSPLOWO2_12_FULL_46_10]|uniref:Uncharacterized protein n=1 Tax=Candidatus Uhrbacteria bacterium RIFCSPLOWO2_01_FULL_47_25 TaxID=1802402 RepID=A0A1F7UV82_9BACT|nr:MAG: hypothetical protein UX68_C0011G0022 [Parcubacteria group bacterium GW2011_GWA2_46_9]OGL59062.1 MAG: hypothetical protein A2752_02500 [Candidatus Uhrbacteria bacterium RIFCSPHIGHO2_01_FULL_46_23]OGL68729.1 MAG: hypothetical protein A3D60_02105 [Candidatus Uhrbacteria bacterium RIFCSPHIGHO2_02_FULL_47_29]OGL74755.1 MAG: hypothetical protein A3E96_03390 [Candidatus Uhrbacteria bacterium RIFCSPHIGHO2_12_FULL_46_13]OGL82166.1 MAG: hypothetical protein A2936_01220 [Candidatus Uhrbacteria bac
MAALVPRSILIGAVASLALFGLSFGVTSLVSGADFAWRQFSSLWYWMAALIVGFGVEVGLFAYLRGSHNHPSAGVVAGGGAGSTIAMVACCAHRLVDFLPFLGLTLFAAALIKYQVYLLAASVLFNLAGIAYLIMMIRKTNLINS